MKPWFKILMAAAAGIVLAASGTAQQSPIMTVSITEITATTGKVDQIRLLHKGSGYITPPAVVIDPPPVGENSLQATATAILDVDGSILRIEIGEDGDGYVSPPGVTVEGPGTLGSSTAIAEARLQGTVLPPNESSGPTNSPILIHALAVGTFPLDGFTYTFRINGQLLGTPPNPANGTPAIVAWRPPEPGVYFISVTATDGANTSTSLAVRFFATGTKITSPLANTLVPTGSSVVIQATATAAPAAPNAFVERIDFYADDVKIGSDRTFPYSVMYTPPEAPLSHTIEARGFDNRGDPIEPTSTISITSVTAIPNLPDIRINTPVHNAPIPMPSPGTAIPVEVIASSTTGVITKVELYKDGVFFGERTEHPYVFEWTPTVAGTYTFVALAYDDKNNVVATNSSTAPTASPVPTTVILTTPDAGAASALPVVAITSPESGSVRVNSSMKLRAAASDPDGLIASVQFFANGTSLAAPITAYPYEMQWKPTAEGVYRITAVAVDDTGAAATSPTVVVVSSAGAAGSEVATGTYGGPAAAGGIEFGNFAFVSGAGGTAAYIGYSTTSGIDKTYFISGIPMNVAGGFSKSDSSGKTLISGTGTSGMVDNGRISFVGLDTTALAGDTAFPGGFYSGSLSGRAGSTLAAILGADGSLVLYAADGSVTDAAGGGMTGKVSASGAFSFVTMRGNTISGQVNPSTRVLTGTLSGPNGGSFNLGPSTLAFPGGSIVTGDGVQVGSDIVHPNGNVYDQALIQGASASITADPGQISRISFVDLSNDIVQVEFSGSGTLTLSLENPSGPFPAMYYNQPGVSYMKGHAGIVITGADETTNVSVFSVGPLTAANQNLFKSSVNYDGVADISHIVILSSDGKFGGVFTGNASYFATKGLTGLCAPGVQFTNRVVIGDISASDAASPMLLVGSAPDMLITGGNLWQSNGRAVQVGGFSEVQFVNGTTSHGALIVSQPNQARFEMNGLDATAQIVIQSGQ